MQGRRREREEVPRGGVQVGEDGLRPPCGARAQAEEGRRGRGVRSPSGAFRIQSGGDGEGRGCARIALPHRVLPQVVPVPGGCPHRQDETRTQTQERARGVPQAMEGPVRARGRRDRRRPGGGPGHGADADHEPSAFPGGPRGPPRGRHERDRAVAVPGAVPRGAHVPPAQGEGGDVQGVLQETREGERDDIRHGRRHAAQAGDGPYVREGPGGVHVVVRHDRDPGHDDGQRMRRRAGDGIGSRDGSQDDGYAEKIGSRRRRRPGCDREIHAYDRPISIGLGRHTCSRGYRHRHRGCRKHG